MAEHDQPKNPLIAGAVVAICITVVLVTAGVFQYFDRAIRHEVDVKQNARVDDRLTKLRSMEESNLTGYTWVNKEKGIVRIPLERAIELVLHERAAGAAAPAAPAPAAPAAPAPAAPAPSLSPSPAGAKK
jgi:hypothetical protein